MRVQGVVVPLVTPGGIKGLTREQARRWLNSLPEPVSMGCLCLYYRRRTAVV